MIVHATDKKLILQREVAVLRSEVVGKRQEYMALTQENQRKARKAADLEGKIEAVRRTKEVRQREVPAEAKERLRGEAEDMSQEVGRWRERVRALQDLFDSEQAAQRTNTCVLESKVQEAWRLMKIYNQLNFYAASLCWLTALRPRLCAKCAEVQRSRSRSNTEIKIGGQRSTNPSVRILLEDRACESCVLS